jgi:penicillin amidase
VLFVLMLGGSVGADPGFTTLNVDGDQVRIYRDEFGVPHVFAETNRGLFQGFGYAVAEDRLWQLELFRRASLGRLAEMFGATAIVTNVQLGNLRALDADKDVRTRYYTEAERQLQFSRLDAEETEIFTAYADGINRYLTEVVAPDPANKLPFEFSFLGLGMPEPWTALDVVANAIYQSRFGVAGGMERRNQTLMANLIARHGPATAADIFDDVRWINDPDAPVSVPPEGAIGHRQHATPGPGQLDGASGEALPSEEEKANAVLEALGVPIKSGSHGWVVSAARSANGSPMLFGAPQVGFNTPELFLEVQLKGGNGFDVMGRAFAGVPMIYNGRTNKMAWTMSTGVFGDSRDIYVETPCNGGSGYLFNGVCTPIESRVEVIHVRGAASVNHTVQRTVHGPVVGTAPGFLFTQKRVVWMRELESEKAFLTLNRATNLQEFDSAVRQLEVSHNILYADKVGNIAYWLAGKIPIRPAGFDARLPLPGTGNAEWTGEFRAIPLSINPTRGWLSTWNTKPSVDYPNPDQRSFGKQYRSLEIDQRLQAGPISVDDMKDIAKDIARTETGGDGRESRYLKPYLLAALDAVPPSNPLASQARAVLEAWDGSQFADAVTSTTLAPGQVVFDRWLGIMLVNTFGDELGVEITQATSNMLIHVLDEAKGGGSGVPPSRDYFNGVDPNAAMSAAFDQALVALGANPSAWSTQPRAIVAFRHNLYPTIPEVGTILNSNRACYVNVVVLSNPRPTSESIMSLGQSGFIQLGPSGTPLLDPHFNDQLELFRGFVYKPMRLFLNTQLHE